MNAPAFSKVESNASPTSLSNTPALSTYFRDDIVFVYNSLLYSQGLDIHHLDHPSLFTYFFFFNFL